MKSIPALLLLALVQSINAANKVAIQGCGSAQQCKLGCKDSQFYWAGHDNIEVYECGAPQTWSEFYVGDCGVTGNTSAACNQAGGKLCCSVCVFEVPAGNSQNDVFRLWKKRCNPHNPPFGASLSRPQSYESGLKSLLCPEVKQELESIPEDES